VKAAPEGVAMNPNRMQKEREALKAIRLRWQVRGWKFTPLERIDGMNETIESIDALRNSPVCWSVFGRKHNVEELLDNIEDAYRYALVPWNEFRTVYECAATQREFLRWPDGMFTAKIQREARSRFWELVTTSRFSVNAAPSVFELQRVNYPYGQITLRHVVSLAAIVCLVEAIRALELIDSWWRDDSHLYMQGKSFDWLSEHDPKKIDVILSIMFETPEEIQPHDHQIKESLKALEQADAWLSHQTTMDFNHQETKQAAKVAKTKKSEQAKTAARTPRRAANLTPELVANYFKSRPGEKWEVLHAELSEAYGVSTRTVSRRYKTAKEINLLS
jgi:hypothetical protein